MQIGEEIVREGRVLLITNEERKTNADKYYYQIWVQIKKSIASWVVEEGDDPEIPLVFTEEVFKDAYERGKRLKKSVLQKNKIVDLVD